MAFPYPRTSKKQFRLAHEQGVSQRVNYAFLLPGVTARAKAEIGETTFVAL